MGKNKKNQKIQEREIKKQEDAKQKVVMVFKEDKFYNDLSVPHFKAGEKYVIEGADQIQRWLKRGGDIVEGELKINNPAPDESKIVESPESSSSGQNEEVEMEDDKSEDQESED